MPKPLGKQFKEAVASLITYFEAERDNNGPLLPLCSVRKVNYILIHIAAHYET